MSIFYGTDTRVGKLGLYNGLIKHSNFIHQNQSATFLDGVYCTERNNIILKSIEKSPTVQTHQRDLVKLVRVVDEA